MARKDKMLLPWQSSWAADLEKFAKLVVVNFAKLSFNKKIIKIWSVRLPQVSCPYKERVKCFFVIVFL